MKKMMNRYDTIHMIAKLVGPLGPFGTLENNLEEINNWHDSLDLNSIVVLTDILLNPPSETEIRKIPEYFEGEITDALTAVGKKDVVKFLEKVKPLITLGRIRPVIIDVIGGLRSEYGISFLQLLMEKYNLTDDELIRLSGSLYEIGGLNALELLRKMKVLYSERTLEVLQNIESWIKYLEEKC